MIKMIVDSIAGMAIAVAKNAKFVANSVKSLTAKSIQKAKQIKYKVMHKKSLGNTANEIISNITDTNYMSNDSLNRNIRDIKLDKVELLKNTNKSDVDNIELKANKNRLNTSIDIQGEIQKGLAGIQVNDEIQSLIEDNKKDSITRVANMDASYRDLKIREEKNNRAINEQNKELNRQYKRKQILDDKATRLNKRKDSIDNESLKGIKYSKEEDLHIKNEAIAYENSDRVEEAVKKGIDYKYRSKDGFDFYKVKENISTGDTPVEALDNAGMIPNVQYRLDMNNAGIIRVLDKNAVEVANNIKAQLFIESLIDNKSAIPCVICIKGKTNFSIALLVCDKDISNGFGAFILKRDKLYDNYILDLNKVMFKSNMLNSNKTYNKFSASKSLLRQAFPCAVCIDLDTGYISEYDKKELDMLKNNNKSAYDNIDKIIRGVRGEI